MTTHNRKHYVMSFDELAKLLHIDGEIVHVWREDDNDYLHITAHNPDWPIVADGSYVPAETLMHS